MSAKRLNLDLLSAVYAWHLSGMVLHNGAGLFKCHNGHAAIPFSELT